MINSGEAFRPIYLCNSTHKKCLFGSLYGFQYGENGSCWGLGRGGGELQTYKQSVSVDSFSPEIQEGGSRPIHRAKKGRERARARRAFEREPYTVHRANKGRELSRVGRNPPTPTASSHRLPILRAEQTCNTQAHFNFFLNLFHCNGPPHAQLTLSLNLKCAWQTVREIRAQLTVWYSSQLPALIACLTVCT